VWETVAGKFLVKSLRLARFSGRSTVYAFFVVVGVLAASLSIAWAYDTQDLVGTVVGEVINGTPDGAVPGDLTVTLHAFSGMEETGMYTTTLASDQGFRFEDVSFAQGDTLVVRTVYGGVAYFSEFATVESDQQEVSLPVTIYETTDVRGDVGIAQLHIFVEKTGDRLQIGQYCVVANRANRTYVGSPVTSSGDRWTWSVILPDDAQNLRFETGELGARFVITDQGFADTRAIPPGNAGVEASFTYELPYSEGLGIEEAFDVPVNAAILVLPGGTIGLEGAALSSEETLETQSGPAVSYRAGPLEAGEPLSFTVVPREGPAAETWSVGTSDGLAVGVTALAVAGGVAYWLWRSPLPGPVPAEARSGVEAIAVLDRDFEEGHMSEKVYRKKRRALKRRLRELLSG
jgi:hypothetical protein